MKVSVIIPCYNAEPYLEQTIGSVLCQSQPPAEVIVVDDGSTDNSLAVAQQFDDHVRIVSKANGGAARARNLGVSKATGDALMFLDADDVLGPNVLEGLAAALQREPSGIAICSWYCLRKRSGVWVQTPPNRPPRRHGQDDLEAWLTGWFHTPCSVLWSRKAFARVEEWDPKAGPNDDGEIMMRALTCGVPLVRASFGTAYYRRLPEDETSWSDTRHTEEGLKARMYVVAKIARLLEERGKRQPYEAAIAEALDLIARDCEGRFPNLYEECVVQAKKYGGPPWLRMARKKGGQLISKAVRTWRRNMPLVEPAQQFPEQSEIQFGRHWKERLQKADTTEDEDKKDAASPLVSVIIPTYNRADLLPRALDSVLEQTFDDFEVLVIDDASTDDTREVIQAYADSPVQYMRQPKNRGVSAARNRGLREAKGELIAFLDSDDEWLPKKLKLQVQRFREQPEHVGLVYTGATMIYDDGTEKEKRPTRQGEVYDDLLVKNFVYPTSGIMVRASAAEQVGLFDEQMPANEDWDYWLRCTRQFEIDYVDDLLVRYFAMKGHGRKSLVAQDDLDARARLYEKNAIDMKRTGGAFPFLMESARLHLVPTNWDPQGARRVMAQAARLRPVAPELYVKWLRSLLPRRAYVSMRTWWRSALRSLQETKSRFNVA